MKKNTVSLLFAMLSMAGGTAWAESQTLWITASNESDEILTEVAVTNDSKLRFSPEGIGVYDNDVLSSTIPYEDLFKLTFRYSNTTSVNAIESSWLRLRENPVGDVLEILGYEGEGTVLSLYDAGGRLCLENKEWRGETVNVSNLKAGIYFGIIDKITFKIIKK